MKRPVFPPHFRLDPPPPPPPPPFTSCNPLNRDYSSSSTSSLSPYSTSQPLQVNTIWILQYCKVTPEVQSQLQSRTMNSSLSTSQMVTLHHSSTDLIQLPEVSTTQRSRNSPNLSSLSHVAVGIPKHNNLLTNLELQSTEMTTRQDYGNSPDVIQIPKVSTSQCVRNSPNLLSLSHVSVPEDHSFLQNVELPTPQYYIKSPDLFHSHQVPTPQCRKNSAVLVPEDHSFLQNVKLPTPQYQSNSPDLFHSHQVSTPQCRKNSAVLVPEDHSFLQNVKLPTPQYHGNFPDLFHSHQVSTPRFRKNSTISVPDDHSFLQKVELPTPQNHSKSPDLFHSHQVPTPQCRKNSAISVPEDRSFLQNVELPTPQVPTPQCRKNSATLHPFHNVLVSEDHSNSNPPRLSETPIPRNCSNSPNLFPSLKVPTSQTHRNSSNLHPLHHSPVTEDSTYSSNRPPLPTHFNSKLTRPRNHNRSQKFFPSSKRSAAPLCEIRQHEIICLFCKRNGESSEVYRSHNLKDMNGRITCPILFKYVCPTCQATGENAHTKSYCPANSQAISVSKFVQRCNPTGHPVYIKP